MHWVPTHPKGGRGPRFRSRPPLARDSGKPSWAPKTTFTFGRRCTALSQWPGAESSLSRTILFGGPARDSTIRSHELRHPSWARLSAQIAIDLSLSMHTSHRDEDHNMRRLLVRPRGGLILTYRVLLQAPRMSENTGTAGSIVFLRVTYRFGNVVGNQLPLAARAGQGSGKTKF